MGPEATAIFCRILTQLTPAARDQEHLTVYTLNDPTIPDRVSHIFGHGESPLQHLIRLVQQLERWGADFISIPCNTVHYLWKEMQQSVRIPILHIIEETVKEVSQTAFDQRRGNANRIGILATRGTIHLQLYQKSLIQSGLIPLVPSQNTQDRVQQSIVCIKAKQRQEEAVAAIQEAIEELQREGAGAMILGCTELGLFSHRLHSDVPLFDSMTSLARATLRAAVDQKAPF